MKKYLLFLFVLLAMYACNTPSIKEKEQYFTKDIGLLTLCYDSLDLDSNFRLRMVDDDFEYFLRQEHLGIYRIESKDTLSVFQELLRQSTLAERDSDMAFDIDVAALVEYSDGSIDTLGIPVNLSRGFICGAQRFENRSFVDSVLHALAFRNNSWKTVLERTYWKGDYTYYGAPIYTKGHYVPNYGMFANTEAESLARNMYLENIDSIRTIVNQNPSLMYAVDVRGTPLVQHCIKFQQDTILKVLLELGFDPNTYLKEKDKVYEEKFKSCSSVYLPPLMIACENPCFNKMGQLLVQHGADLNPQSPILKGFRPATPLCEAVFNNNYEMAKYLIDRGADVNDYSGSGYLVEEKGTIDLILEKEYIIDTARKSGNFKMMHLFLTHGANIDTPYSRRVGDFRSYIESVNPEELTSADRRYLQKIKNYLKSHYPERMDGVELKKN